MEDRRKKANDKDDVWALSRMLKCVKRNEIRNKNIFFFCLSVCYLQITAVTEALTDEF